MLALWLLLSTSARASCEDTGVYDTATKREDCDGDGYRKMDGDCDDRDPKVNPGEAEVCGDHLDNDCNGLFDDGCDESAQRATLLGGSACQDANAGFAFVLLPLALIRRRR